MSKLNDQLTGPITKSDYVYRRSRLSIAIIGFAVISYILLSQSFKTLDDLTIVTGQLVHTEVLRERYKGNNYRYTFAFKLNTMNQYLGIFLGSGRNAINDGKSWESKLKIGDNLKVFYDNNLITESENITRLIRRIEKGNEVIYQTGTKGKRIIGLIILCIDLLFIGLLYWIKKRYDLTKKKRMN